MMTQANLRSPTLRPGTLILLVATALVSAHAHAQLAHKGPAAAIALAQTVQPFDVVSIRQNNTGANNGTWDVDDHGVYTGKDITLAAIIEFAYDVKADQIAGLSGPVSSAWFDITAKVLPPEGQPPALLPDENLQAMAVRMLSDRFGLKVHLQPKIVAVYDLVVAHGEPKLKLSQDEIHENNWRSSFSGTDRIVNGKNISMTDLADALSDLAGRKVINKTGLAGHADITLKWSDDVAVTQGGPNVVSIFTAVEEQLGLKLQPSKGPVDTLVIDHAEMPSEN
jgi:bla regulator protein BlaR1